MTMTDQKMYTLGPTDPNAGTRARIYSVLTLITPLLGFLATFGILSSDQADSINGFIAAATGLLGTFGLLGFGMAAKNTNRQVKDGTFDPVPPVEPHPVTNAFDGLTQLQAGVNDAVEQAKSKVAEGVAVIQGAAAMIPGGKPAADAVMDGPLGDLLRAVTSGKG
ncbi:hypothetical protein A5784_35225 [Mycobacterium sp. 852013-50091_SCH5140682]|uniref:hypothetical protein n=1 Tax=Mycobacterium sp. 852013-50091_SCH5140682 TaxID=1834109 RepID=UPI0007EAB561|nr:hypothetical protein [Mycobacterium sp. 852013-50091_SCH5140682]OBC11449.1 hypothetical protein A5784_35225 [Mycobacterium sp. 852013-50091_SCH5140682]